MGWVCVGLAALGACGLLTGILIGALKPWADRINAANKGKTAR